LDFDLGKATSLALVQFLICGTVSLLAFLVPLPQTNGLGLDRVLQRLDGRRHRLWDGFWISIATAFLVLPLGAVLFRGLRHLLELPPQILAASVTSLTIAIISTALCLAMALSLSLAFARRGALARSLAEATGILGLASSPLVVGTGLFVLIFPYAQPMDFALPITASVNAMMALPFALRVLMPAVQETYGDYLLFAYEPWNGPLDLGETDFRASPASPDWVFGWSRCGALNGRSWCDCAFCGS
jgi:thiamine transport system permease protein